MNDIFHQLFGTDVRVVIVFALIGNPANRYCILRADMLSKAKETMKVLHPLPRVNEIAYDVDSTPQAYYIQQAQNGLYAREAIICDVLGITLDDVRNDTTIIHSPYPAR